MFASILLLLFFKHNPIYTECLQERQASWFHIFSVNFLSVMVSVDWFAISAQTVKDGGKYHWKCGSVTVWLDVRNLVKPWLSIPLVSLKCVYLGLTYLWNYLVCKVGVMIHPNDHTLVGIENDAQQQNFSDQAILIWKELRWKKYVFFLYLANALCVFRCE